MKRLHPGEAQMDTRDDKTDIIARYEAESFIATQFRRLYYNIKLEDGGRKVKSFLVTSSNRGEGKSTITALLGLTAAQFSKNKVLIVDADFRRPRVNKLFNLDTDVGMRDCLEKGLDPNRVAMNTSIPNLRVITAGTPTDQPSILFESEALSSFFNQVTFYHDIVIVDSAPVLAVSDTLFLCPEVELVLFVVLAGATPREVAKRAMQTLEDSKAKATGIVLNNALEVLPYYYDRKYYGDD
jgi:capsular exopolysaccharide synthesis family protein